MPAWLKAGLIGALVLVVINLLNFIPVILIGCLVFLLTLGAYIGTGVLAASYMAPPRDAGNGAAQGALAGLVAGALGGIINAILGAARASFTTTSDMLNQLPPEMRGEMLRLMQQWGIGQTGLNATGSVIGALLGGLICCTLGIFFAAALGAVGGAIYGASKRGI